MGKHSDKNWKLWKDMTFIIGLCLVAVVVIGFIVVYLEKG